MERLMNSDRKATEELINSMRPTPPAKRAVDFISHEDGKGGFENKTWDQLDKCGLLAVLKNSDPGLFAAKYKERFGVDYNN